MNFKWASKLNQSNKQIIIIILIFSFIYSQCKTIEPKYLKINPPNIDSLKVDVKSQGTLSLVLDNTELPNKEEINVNLCISKTFVEFNDCWEIQNVSFGMLVANKTVSALLSDGFYTIYLKIEVPSWRIEKKANAYFTANDSKEIQIDSMGNCSKKIDFWRLEFRCDPIIIKTKKVTEIKIKLKDKLEIFPESFLIAILTLGFVSTPSTLQQMDIIVSESN